MHKRSITDFFAPVCSATKKTKRATEEPAKHFWFFALEWNSSNGQFRPQLFYSKEEAEAFLPQEQRTWSATNVRLKNAPASNEEVYLTLCTNLPLDATIHLEEESEAVDHSFTVVKSMIQKGVRRRMVEEVRNLATYACQSSFLNFKELVRRIPVIAVEDVTLHPGLPVVVWLMIAFAKDFRPLDLFPFHQVAVCILSDLAAAKYKDWLPEVDLDLDAVKEGGERVGDEEMNAECRTLWSCLWMRQAYGGLKGDVVMLRRYTQLWRLRFVSSCGKCNETTTSSNFDYLHSSFVEGLQRNAFGARILSLYSTSGGLAPAGPLQLIEEGWDFHCDWAMLSKIAKCSLRPAAAATETEPEDDKLEKIKRCIWLFRSSTNHHSIWSEVLTPWELERFQKQREKEEENKRELHDFWKTIEREVVYYSKTRCATSSLKNRRIR